MDRSVTDVKLRDWRLWSIPVSFLMAAFALIEFGYHVKINLMSFALIALMTAAILRVSIPVIRKWEWNRNTVALAWCTNLFVFWICFLTIRIMH